MAPAEACYQAMLEIDPRCAQVLHLLGMTAQQAGRPEEAIQLMSEALALAPDDPYTLNDLGGSYLIRGEIESAMNCYQRLVELRPDSARAHYCFGVTQELLKLLDASKDSFRRAVTLEPGSAEFHCARARAHYKSGDPQAAAVGFERALALDPNRYEIHNGLGLALTDLGQYEAAAAILQKGYALQPESAELSASLGYLFEAKGDLASSAEAYRRAIRLAPKLAGAHRELGLVLFALGEMAEAEECFERVRALDPDSAEATFYLATIHLLEGKLALGWSEYESRWRTGAGLRTRRTFPQPQWKGEPLEGARILIYAEQGLGDTLQFVRYVPLVAARGGQVILEVQPELQRLLTSIEAGWQVLSRGQTLPDFTWQCPMLSMPLAFATEMSTIPGQTPYIYPDPALREVWKQRLEDVALRIGLVWAGGRHHGFDRWRSIPLAQFAPLTKLEGATFYSLQTGEAAEQVKQSEAPVRLVDLRDEMQDFADTAAIIANLDLVITVDTAVAHLAGALGKPVWILLTNAPDWRWFLEREDSPWYPTARLFRQSTHGNWQEVLARLERELRKLLGLP
jgi:tetratricopeptide (TPR) repeat protein